MGPSCWRNVIGPLEERDGLSFTSFTRQTLHGLFTRADCCDKSKRIWGTFRLRSQVNHFSEETWNAAWKSFTFLTGAIKFSIH